MNLNGLIPTRFMLLISHLVLTVILFSSIAQIQHLSHISTVTEYSSQTVDLFMANGKDDNILACLPEGNTDVSSKLTSYNVGLGVTLGLIAVELIGFISGVTMFMPFQDMISIIAHCSASISLAFFIFETWPCSWFWWIFGFCSVFPAFTEILAIIGFVLNWNF